MNYEDILYEVNGPIATITLNRPDSLNAISPRLEHEMHGAFDAADRDRKVRAIILTGAGRAFSSGYDLSGEDEMKRPPDVSVDEFLADWYRVSMDGVDAILHMWRIGKPIIAAVNGWCMGGGLWYQTACDISIASEKAVFAQPEVRMISNSTFLFAALCGWKVANRWTLTGDHMDAQEAMRVGLVNEVVPHDELIPRTEKLANRIAMVPEASVRLNRAIALQGLLSSGLFAGHLLSGPLSTIVQASIGGPERIRLDEAFARGGMRAFLDERDGPFQPEPGGPKSRVKAST
jgi:enoyl-CoA hydratase/carnithine racemase